MTLKYRTPPARPSWRDYQKQLQRPARSKKAKRLAILGVIVAAILGSLYLGPSSPQATNNPSMLASEPPAPRLEESRIKKSDVQFLLKQLNLNELTTPSIGLSFDGQPVRVETSLDPELQQLLIRGMDRKNSRFVGIVVMEADSGRILALAGFDKTNPRANPCLSSAFPAASLFKIVTATAAVDRFNYTSDTPLSFNGFKHTLYKSQLKESSNQFTHTISFADAFAQSVNPVFGKIGTLRLGKQLIETYAQGFGFNQPLDFELPVAPSRIEVSDTPYHWAEIASGFNYDTTISPVHAAEMVSAVLNEGRMKVPSIVDRIVAADGQVLYRSHASREQQVMSPKASKVMADLMERTVTAGTARRTFKTKKSNDIIADLRIGGKTGSISSRNHDARFDWFVGFAQAKQGQGQIVVSVMVAHEEYIGVRAGTYARTAISHYFQNRLSPAEGSRD